MKIVDTNEVPRIGIEKTFRHSRVAPVIVLIVLASATAWWTTAFALDEGASWQHWLPTGMGVLMMLVTLWSLFTTLSRSNWLLHVAQDGVYIKFRSYLNARYPDNAPTVLHLNYSDIAWVRAARRTVSVPEGSRGTETDTVRFLEIGLRDEASQELADALAHERSLRAIPNGRAKHHDYPLRIAEPRLLRMVWKVSATPKAAVQAIGAHAAVEEDAVHPEFRWDALSDAEKDFLITEMAEFGKRMAAKRLAAEHFGVSRSEAEEHIDALMSRAPR